METLWSEPGSFRLFISHVTSFKKKTSALRQALYRYGISAFVAHEEIEPTAVWESQILNALTTADALLALITKGFHRSKWTDQEIGVALGREILIVPVRIDMNPYGFLSKQQYLRWNGKQVPGVAKRIMNVLVRNTRTSGRMAEAFVAYLERLSDASHWTLVLHSLDLLELLPSLNTDQLHRVQIAAEARLRVEETAHELNFFRFTQRLKQLMERHGFSRLT